MADWGITEEHKKKMSAFMADFWSLIKASYEMPPDDDDSTIQTNHYWKTLTDWVDALSRKYGGDLVINGILLGYMQGQNDKSVNSVIKRKIKTDTT